jgi:glutathione S-transferase
MTLSLPILYTFRRCPYAMRARMALYTAKVSHEHREVNLKNKPQEMLAISPKGTVPVLQLGDGNVLEESLDIMKWALNISHLPSEETALITENDTTFKKALDRYKYPGRYPEDDGIDYRSQLEYRNLCEFFLKKLEGQLLPFLTGTTATLIDMALFPFVRQFAMVDPVWFETQPYPRLKAWLDFWISGALFSQVMQEYPLWISGAEPTIVVF